MTINHKCIELIFVSTSFELSSNRKTKNTYAIFRSCIMRYSVKMKHKTK